MHSLLAKLQGEAPKEPAPCDVLQLSAQAQRVARSLCHQAAPRGGSANLRLGPSPVVCATPAETFARRTDRAYEASSPPCHLHSHGICRGEQPCLEPRHCGARLCHLTLAAWLKLGVHCACAAERAGCLLIISLPSSHLMRSLPVTRATLHAYVILM